MEKEFLIASREDTTAETAQVEAASAVAFQLLSTLAINKNRIGALHITLVLYHTLVMEEVRECVKAFV